MLGIVYVISRLPWINLGYGADPDAWRVAMSARYLIEHGSYLPSRLPGYPVHDLLMVPLLFGGWVLTNAASVAVSLLGVYLFAVIVRRLRLRCTGLLTLTFAFLPLLWSVSTMTLDYSWALTFFLGAYLALLRGRPLCSGILLGLAGGCRISYLVFVLPFALLLWRTREMRPVLRFAAATSLTWLIVFAPVWARYGTRFWNFYDVRPDWGDFLHALTEQSLGLLPLAALAVACACSWRQLRHLPALLRSDPHANLWAMVVLLALFIYVRLPLQTYYLIPAVPGGLIVLAQILRRPLLLGVCLTLVLAGFVDVYTTSAGGWRSPSALQHVRPQRGLVLQDYRLRSDRLTLVRHLRDLALPDHAVITAGFYFPMVAERYHSQLRLTLPDGYLRQVGPLTDNARASDGKVTYVWLLTQGDARTLIREGYQVSSLDFSRQARRPVVNRIYLPENESFGIH